MEREKSLLFVYAPARIPEVVVVWEARKKLPGFRRYVRLHRVEQLRGLSPKGVDIAHIGPIERDILEEIKARGFNLSQIHNLDTLETAT